MKTLDELHAKLDTLASELQAAREAGRKYAEEMAESQGRLLAALNDHDEWAKAVNVKVKAEVEASKAENELRAKGWTEAATQIADLLSKTVAATQYMTTVVDHIYDFQRKPQPKRKRGRK